MSAPSKAALKLALECAEAAQAEHGHKGPAIWAVEAALAAIEKTTELARAAAKQIILDARMGEIDTDLRCIGRILDSRLALIASKGQADE